MVWIVQCRRDVNNISPGSVRSENGIHDSGERLGVRPFVAASQFSRKLFNRITVNQFNRGRCSIIVNPKRSTGRSSPSAGERPLEVRFFIGRRRHPRQCASCPEFRGICGGSTLMPRVE